MYFAKSSNLASKRSSPGASECFLPWNRPGQDLTTLRCKADLCQATPTAALLGTVRRVGVQRPRSTMGSWADAVLQSRWARRLMAEALTLYHRHNVCREEDKEGSRDLTLHSRRDRNVCAPLFNLFSPFSETDLCLGKGHSGGPPVTGTHCLSAESSVKHTPRTTGSGVSDLSLAKPMTKAAGLC